MIDPARPMSGVIMAWAEWVLAGHCWIKDRKTGQLVQLVPNKAQSFMMRMILWQANEGKPIRLIVYKARKMGFSTLVQSLLWFIAAHVPLWQSVTVAHSQDDTKQIFEIAKLIHTNAGFPKPSTLSIQIPDMGSYIARTAGGHFVQSGSTPNALHVSELAKCERVAEMSTEAMSSLLNAVPSTSASTIVVIESTPEGPFGEFYNRVRAAQAKRGEFELLFFPWFDDPDYTDGPGEMPDLDDYEADLVRRFKLDSGQIRWRRRILQDNHGGNVTQFKRNYPATIEEGFETAEGRCLPAFDRAIHVRKGPPFRDEPSRDYLGIDWGAGASPFVCLWITHYPFRKPGYSQDSSCDSLADEFYSYVRDPETDQPIHDHCHGIDALAYSVIGSRMTGHVHVKRELFIPQAAEKGYTLQTLAEAVLKMVGDATIMAAIADRAEPLSIRTFSQQGIPCMAYKPLPKTPFGGDIEQRIKHLHALMLGADSWMRHDPSALDVAKQKLSTAKTEDGREKYVTLTRQEQRAVDEDQRRRNRKRLMDVGDV